MSLGSIVDVSIIANTTSPSRAGFGTPGLLAHFPTTLFPERVRSYSSLSGMVADGFLPSDPAYLMATALKAQNPSVSGWKMCRRALPSVQSIRVTPTITTEGEVLLFTVNGIELSYTIPSSATIASIVTALTALVVADSVPGATASDDTTHMTITPYRWATVTLTVDVADALEFYTVVIDGVSYTIQADGTPTVTEIRDALQAAVIAGGYAASEVVDNGAGALDFVFASRIGVGTFSQNSTSELSMSLSGITTAFSLVSVGGFGTGIEVKDLTPDPGIATDWAAITAEDVDFYAVGLDSESEAEVKALAALVETQRMLFVASSIDTENMDSGTTDDLGSELKALAYARTGVIQTLYNSQYGGLRWLGKMLPKDPGSATWSYKTLRGLTVGELTTAELSGLNGKNINHYTIVGGVNVTQKGFSASGEYLDITRGVDWFQARLQERIYGLLVRNDKIPYDLAGDLFRAEILAQMQQAQNRGVLAPDVEATPWVITVPEVADISTADKALRNFPDIEFSAFLAGAVHTIQITGILSL